MKFEMVKDSAGKTYKRLGELCFSPETPDNLCEVLNELSRNRRTERVRIFYGDGKTGKDWHEENDVTGYIGRSTGTIKIPLLVAKANSMGGPGILDSCIVKIVSTQKPYRTLYKHPTYACGTFEKRKGDHKDYPYEVFIDGELQARFENEKQANAYIAKMTMGE